MHFRLDDDGEVLAAGPTPLAEVRPQVGHERHCGCGFELLLDVTVPPTGGELVEVPNVVSQVVEQNVDIPVHGGMEYISPEPAVFRLPELAVEYLAPTPAVSRLASTSGGVHQTPTGIVSNTSAFGGVFCTRDSGVPIASDCRGVHCACASRVRSTHTSC